MSALLVLVLVVVSVVRGEEKEEEEEGKERPVKVLAKNGRRPRAHSGPCSWIEAVGVKYLDRVSAGGEPAMKAEMKAWVWRVRGDGDGVFLCEVEDMVWDYGWAMMVGYVFEVK